MSKTLRLVPTRMGIMYECPECDARFLPAIADFHSCEVSAEEEEDTTDYSASPTPTFSRVFHRATGL